MEEGLICGDLQGTPTGLIVYPNEGHGFDHPDHQRDRDRRMLAWFTKYLPLQ
jgi:dipeptidyl aminopeptidase/acylaminoacyl peptidase